MRDTWAGAMLGAAFLAISFGAGCDSLPGRPNPANRPISPYEVKDFSLLYGENCAGCHGADGRFGAGPPLNNPVYMAIVDEATMRNVIAKGIEGTAMPAFAIDAGGDLTADQVDILVAGMRNRWASGNGRAAGAPSYSSGGAGNPQQGAQAYAEYCRGCHGASGDRPGPAGSITDSAFLSLVSDQFLRTFLIAGRDDLGHPDWRGYPSKPPLTGEQISDLVAWLTSQRNSVATLSSSQNP